MSRNSRTPSWAFFVVSLWVSTAMPSLAVIMHDGCSVGPRPVSTSTMHIRHIPTGRILGW